MQKGFFVLLASFLLFNASYADQLAWLSKADADRGAACIEKAKKVALFCGCCDNQEIEKIKVKGLEVKYTGTENYYEVYVYYQYQGELKIVPVDLAYVWVNINGKVQTVGQVLGLDHDPCKTPAW